MKQFFQWAIPVIALLINHTVLGQQEDGAVGLSGSGFLTLGAGRIFKGDPQQDFNGYRAPIYVADYAQGGVYESGGWSMNPVSRLGLQGTASFNPRLSLTGQVVARAARDGKVDLEWVYGSYAINDELQLQLGRKRLPLFYYSESQDVGFAYPWIHLPPGQYGWEIVNYNGANLLYRGQWGAWSTDMNFFAGGETRTDNPFEKIYNGKNTRTDSKWTNIRGADLSLAREWFEARAAYIQSSFQDRPEGSGYSPAARQRIYSLSFNIDYRNCLVHNEYLYLDRKPAGEVDYSVLLGVGYRIGKYLPMLTYNRYWMKSTPGATDPAIVDPASIDPLADEAWATTALSLRYDLTSTSAFKIQIDRWRDENGPAFNGGVPYGNARLLSISYDMVF